MKYWGNTGSGPLLSAIVCLVVLLVNSAFANAPISAKRYPTKGLILKVDEAQQTMIVSCERIPGYMEAMVMPIAVRTRKELQPLVPGTMVEFTLVVDAESAHAEDIHVHGFQSLEQDPLAARRLALLSGIIDPAWSGKSIGIGQPVPDFSLIDQSRRPVKLSDFAGKTVAISFIYTRCPLPNYCFRMSSNFGRLQKRFPDAMGRKLVLLSITFDPVHDQPETLAQYASIWHADLKGWHFLTGAEPQIQTIAHRFGMDYWADEGLMVHSLHTVIVAPDGKLSANLEGNEFSADQLGDLIETIMKKPNSIGR
jgi:protein SCO1